MRRTLRVLLFFAATAALFPATVGRHKKPKLVLAIVVDQFRYDYLLRFREDYHAGFDRLLEHGAVFTDAHYPQAATVTAVGHATILSGAPPSISGIVANSWWERESGKTVNSITDDGTKLVGGLPGKAGASPQRLLVSTVPDELKIRDANTHVIGISLKDRSAILPAGHAADAAYWYSDESHTWVTSTYYRQDLPAWVQSVNAEHGYEKIAVAQWFPVDAKPGSAQPFCTMVQGGAPRYCGDVDSTPWGNEMTEELAERAVDGEKLGRHSGVDVLTVSFSANDYVGHKVGPDDPAVRDISIRTDRLIGKLLDYIDKVVGEGNTLVVMTADHGVSPLPDVNHARKMPGGLLKEADVAKAMADALTKKFGAGDWLLPGGVTTNPYMPYLNWSLMRAKGLDVAQVEDVAAEAAAGVAHVAHVYTRQQLMNGAAGGDPIAKAMELSFFAPRAGDLLVLGEPYFPFESTYMAGHGTPYDYDTHVPVIFMGPGIKAGEYRGKIAVTDIAPTLAELLDIEAPSGSIGRVLAEMLP